LEIPSIPSSEWDKLGFGVFPNLEFDEIGEFGIRCILALTKFFDFFMELKSSAEEFGIPFGVVSVKVVKIIYDFLGWNNTGLPKCNRPETFQILGKILFHFSYDTENEKLFRKSKNVFYKIYFAIFGLMASIWREIKTISLEKLVEKTIQGWEENLKIVTNRFCLDRFLVKELGLSNINSKNNPSKPTKFPNFRGNSTFHQSEKRSE